MEVSGSEDGTRRAGRQSSGIEHESRRNVDLEGSQKVGKYRGLLRSWRTKHKINAKSENLGRSTVKN